MAFGRTLPPWFGRQSAPPVDPSIMGMLPQAQQFTAGQQIAPAAAAAPLVEQQGPSRADVARAQDIAGGVDTGYGLENVRDPWSALAYAVNKGVTGYAQGKAKRMGETQKAADRKALADALNSADPKTALSQLDIPEVQDMMVQSKLAAMSKAPAEKWQDVDTNNDGQPDAQRSSISGEYKTIDRPMSVEDKLRIAAAGASRTSVNVSPGERAFDKGVGEFQAKAFGEMAAEGNTAKGDIGVIGELEDRLAATPGGILGGLQALGNSLGVPIGKGASDAQAANAIIARLVPSQRMAGSGPMSDRDVQLFKDSLPQLINSPAGNAMIISTMRAMAQFKIDQGRIAAAAMNGQLTRQQAQEAVMNLPDPLAQFKARKAGTTVKPGPRKELNFNPATGTVE